MNWFSVIACLSLLVFNTAAFANYTLVLSQSQHLNESQERALLATGIVPFSCELVNQVGTYIVRCGQNEHEEFFDPYIKRLKELDIEAKVEAYQDVPVLFNYEPITLGEETQAYLSALAQQELSAKSSKQAHKPVQTVTTQWDKEQFRQGLYFVDRGWAAYRSKEYPLAVNLFSLAEQIPKLKNAAQYGKALTLMATDEHENAMELMWQLFERGFNREDVVPSLLELANQAGRNDLISKILPTLSSDEQAKWQLIILETELKHYIKKSPIDIAYVKAQFSSLISACQGFDTWLKLLKNVPTDDDRIYLIETLNKHCNQPTQIISLAYMASEIFKKKTNYVVADTYFQNQQIKLSKKSQQIEINQIRFNTLLAIASSKSLSPSEQLDIYLHMGKFWPKNISLKFATAWHYYNNNDYQQSLELFERIFSIKPSQEAAKGIVLSTLALGDNEGAMKLSEQFGDRALYFSALERQLAKQTIPSKDSFDTAQKILQIKPDHLASHAATAWYLFDAKQFEDALITFKRWHKLAPENDDTVVGQVLCLVELKDDVALKALVEQFPKHQPRAFDALATTHFEQEKYDEANVYFEQLLNIQPLDQAQQSMYAWSLSKTKNYAKSTAIFSSLLTETSDSNALTGLLANYTATNNQSELATLIAKYHDDEEHKKLFIEFGLANKNWLSFATETQLETEKSAASFYNVNKPFIWYRAETIGKKGDNGTSKLDLDVQQLGASFSHNQHQVNIALQHYDIGSGSVSGTPSIGSDYLASTPLEFITNDSQTFLLLQYHHQGDSNFTATIAQAPKIDEINTSLHWRLQWQFDNYKASLFDRPLYDSKLALLGEVDPYTNTPFGKMHDKGAELSVSAKLSDSWSSNLLASYSLIKGTNTLDNKHINLNASMATNSKFMGNELIYGAFVNWQKFQRNSNAYYFGHGGYFSPQFLAVAGGFARYHQYNEVDWWFVDLSLSYFNYKTDPIEQYPLTSRTETISSETNAGIGVNIALEKHWLFASHFELGLGAQYQVSPGYDFYRFGINLRYLFSPRQNAWPRQHALSQGSLFQAYSPWLERK